MGQLTPLPGQKGPGLHGRSLSVLLGFSVRLSQIWTTESIRIHENLPPAWAVKFQHPRRACHCSNESLFNKMLLFLEFPPSRSLTSPSPHSQDLKLWETQKFLYKDTLSPQTSFLPSLHLFLKAFHLSKCFKYLMKPISTFISP